MTCKTFQNGHNTFFGDDIIENEVDSNIRNGKKNFLNGQ